MDASSAYRFHFGSYMVTPFRIETSITFLGIGQCRSIICIRTYTGTFLRSQMTPVLLAPEGLLVQISALGAVSGSLLFFYPKGTSPCSLPKFFVRLAHPCRFPGSLPKTCISLSLWAFIPSWREGAPSISDVRLPGDEHWHGQLPGSPNSDASWPSLRSFLVYLGQCQEPGCQLASLIGKLDSLSLSSLGMSLQASFWEIFLGLLVSDHPVSFGPWFMESQSQWFCPSWLNARVPHAGHSLDSPLHRCLNVGDWSSMAHILAASPVPIFIWRHSFQAS